MFESKNLFKELPLAHLYHENSQHLRNIRLAVYHWNHEEYDACEQKCLEITAYAEERLWPCLWAREMYGNIQFFKGNLVSSLKTFTAILEEDPLAISSRYYLMRYFPNSFVKAIAAKKISMEEINALPKNWIPYINPTDFCYHAAIVSMSDLAKIKLPSCPIEKACIMLALQFKTDNSAAWFESFYQENKELIWSGIAKSELFCADIKNHFKMKCSTYELLKIAQAMKEHDPFNIETQVVIDQLQEAVTISQLGLASVDDESVNEASTWLKREFQL
jgi:hypothetical protein